MASSGMRDCVAQGTHVTDGDGAGAPVAVCHTSGVLRLGLTGGIGAGKSTVSAQLRELGALVVDADVVAREVVAPGTAGLASVAAEFGRDVLAADGSLDRAALAQRIFADDAARGTLNSILHPLIGARTGELVAAAPPDAVLVHDIPLLVENGMGAAFHLVMVVHAPAAQRIARLVASRAMTREQAQARIATQADDAARRAAADVWLDNGAHPEALTAAVLAVWQQRLVPFEANVRRRSWARNHPVLVPADPTWPAQAQRLIARLRRVFGSAAASVDHIGSTAVPGLDAKDVLDLQVSVASLAQADELVDQLADAGFPRHVYTQDNPKPQRPDPAQWRTRLHVSADPARAANVHVRVQGSAGQEFALLFRDWLRAEPALMSEYLAVKRRAAADAAEILDYVAVKEPWFDAVYPRALAWARSTGWVTGAS